MNALTMLKQYYFTWSFLQCAFINYGLWDTSAKSTTEIAQFYTVLCQIILFQRKNARCHKYFVSTHYQQQHVQQSLHHQLNQTSNDADFSSIVVTFDRFV